MPVGFDLDLLRTFVTIVDSGSFTRAAMRLNKTQSTVSLQVKRLEEALQRRLFERDTRTVSVTADGELLLTYARRILGLSDEAFTRLTEPGITGIVRFGTPEDFATVYLPEVLARFAQSHPNVSLEVECDLTLNLLKGFEAGGFDLILIKREASLATMGAEVWRELLVWVGSDANLARPDQPLPLVVSPHPCVYRKRAIEALERAGRPWRVTYVSPSLAGQQAAVRAGLGVTILPRLMVPAGLGVLGADHGLPALNDTEIALVRAKTISRAAERLADHIVRSLEARHWPKLEQREVASAVA